MLCKAGLNSYYRARYYDSEIGRFISEDPVGFDGGVNAYSYVANDPLDFGDPLGQKRLHPKKKGCCDAHLPSDPIANIVSRLIFAEATETNDISDGDSWEEMLALAFEPINRADYVASNPKDHGVFGKGTSPRIPGTIVSQQFGSLSQPKFKNPLYVVNDPRLGTKGQHAMCDFLKRAIQAANFALQNPAADPFNSLGGVFGNRLRGHGSPGSPRFYPLPDIPGSNNTFWGLSR